MGTYSLSPKNVDGSPRTQARHPAPPLNVHVVVLLHVHAKVVGDLQVCVQVVVVVEMLKFSVKNTVCRSKKYFSSSSTLLTSFSTYLSITPSMITSTLLTALSIYLSITPSMTTTRLKIVIMKRLNT
jgi:hypothetical protein